MALVRLLGQDIGYSASPAMHSAAFAALALDHRYELADLRAGDLARAIGELRSRDVLGANVTVPHKAAVMPFLDEVDASAERAGAVNTIVSRCGRLTGSNTDIPAIADEIGRLVGRPRRTIVLGAGGAARAVKLALESLGTDDVSLVAASGRGGAFPWRELPDLLRDADLVVNATPVGTTSNVAPIVRELLHPRLAVFDLVYRPSPTRLVREARECGLRARAGAGVLLGQGWRSLEAWLRAPVDASVKAAMGQALRREIGDGADV